MSVPNGVLNGVLADLTAEGEYVESLVAELDESGWRTATPAEGWDIATTIAHLLWTDETAVKSVDGTLCLNGPEDKAPWDEVVTRALADITGFVDAEAIAIAETHTGAEILERWRTSRTLLKDKLRTVPDGQKLMWFGPPMSPASMATARLMESWAHGIDVAEGQGITHEQTDRVRHVASLGHRTRNYSFVNSGLDAPAEEFRVELTLPSGQLWSAGPEDAAQTVTGSAYDFALLVTQRRHRDDLNLTATGADAETWLKIAQAFAGPAGGGREPLNQGDSA
jgi:uncharacterized protein (TIGR03084 family)